MRIALFHNTLSDKAKQAIYERTWRLVSNHQIEVYTLGRQQHHHLFDFCASEINGNDGTIWVI